MNWVRTTRRPLAIVALLALLMAGCGGDDGGLNVGDRSSDRTEEDSDEDSDDSDSSDDSSDSDSSDSSDDSDSSDESDDSDAPEASRTFCAIAERGDEVGSAFATAILGGDPEEIEDALDELIDTARDAADAAPAEIRDTLNDSVETLEQFKVLLDEHDYDLIAAAADPDYEEIVQESEDSDADVEAYLEDACGIGVSDDFTDFGDFTDFTDFTDLSDFSDLFSDFTDFSDFSDLFSDFSDFTDFGDFSDFSIDEDLAVEQLMDFYPKLDEDQARCLVENTTGSFDSEGGDYLDILADCNIELSDLTP